MKLGFVVLCVAVGCRTATLPPTAARVVRVVPPPSMVPLSPEQIRVARVQDEVSAIRGLPFRRAVPFSRQSRDDFRAFVKHELATELPPEKDRDTSRAYRHMGLLRDAKDLGALLEDAHTTQVAAYYDPRTGTFHVLGDPKPKDDDELDGVMAHELQHALQHQHFDLIAFSGGEHNAQKLSDDQLAARQFVTEGEAMFVMMAYQLASGTGSQKRLGPVAVAALRLSMTMLAALGATELMALARAGGAATHTDDLDALARLPPVISTSLVAPYTKGGLLVSETWGRGGWKAVASLFTDPPESTEQVLHPVEKYLAARDRPTIIGSETALPLPAGARLLLSEVQGELGYQSYFLTWDVPAAAGDAAAAGWDGDRSWEWDIKGRTVGVAASRWDSDADASEYVRAFASTLQKRLNLQRPATIGVDGTVRARRPDGSVVVVRQRGKDVDLVDGATASEVAGFLETLRTLPRRSL